jgi:hypothetical protein
MKTNLILAFVFVSGAVFSQGEKELQTNFNLKEAQDFALENN